MMSRNCLKMEAKRDKLLKKIIVLESQRDVLLKKIEKELGR